MARWTLTGYANQVRIFLFLLILFLVMQGALNFSLLFSARDALTRTVRERASETAREVAVELPGARTGDWVTLAPSGVLASLERRHRLEEVALLRVDGSRAASSEGPPSDQLDPDAALLGPTEHRGFLAGREEIRLEVPWRGRARLVVLRPLLRPDGSLAGILKVVMRPHDLAALERRIRTFALLQAVAAIAVLGLTFAFIRWMLRPFRLLLRTAATALPPHTSEEQAIQRPDDLVSAFQGVVDKLQQHEREAAELWSREDGGIIPPAGPVFRNMPSGLVATDGSGRVTALNPAAARLLGVQEGKAMGRPYADVMSSAPDLATLVADCLESGTAHRRVLVAVRGGAGGHVGASVSPIGGEPPEGVLCLFSDLTEIRDVEEKVRLRESLAEVGEISAGIAHEVRNSLATILGYARLAARGSEGETREHAEAIRKEVESVRAVLSDYLRFARPISMNVEPFQLGDVAGEVAETLRQDAVGAQRTILQEGEWPEIEADEALIRQALMNLVRNGLEAVGAGGRVCLRGIVHHQEGEVEVQVHDDGPGPAEGVGPEELFRPFFTTKREGTGLGLALVRKTVVYHDGRIEVSRGPWGGALFTIHLPLEGAGIERKEASRGVTS